MLSLHFVKAISPYSPHFLELQRYPAHLKGLFLITKPSVLLQLFKRQALPAFLTTVAKHSFLSFPSSTGNIFDLKVVQLCYDNYISYLR